MLNMKKSVADGEFLEKLALAVQKSVNGTCAQSPFHVISKQDFKILSAAELQMLFRKKHIVVKDIPHEQRVFDRQSLEMLGSWKQPRTFQGV